MERKCRMQIGQPFAMTTCNTAKRRKLLQGVHSIGDDAYQILSYFPPYCN